MWQILYKPFSYTLSYFILPIKSTRQILLLYTVYRWGHWDNNDKPRIESQVYLGLIYQVRREAGTERERGIPPPAEGFFGGGLPYEGRKWAHAEGQEGEVSSCLRGRISLPTSKQHSEEQTVTNERRHWLLAQQLERSWDCLLQTSPSMSVGRGGMDRRARVPLMRAITY